MTLFALPIVSAISMSIDTGLLITFFFFFFFFFFERWRSQQPFIVKAQVGISGHSVPHSGYDTLGSMPTMLGGQLQVPSMVDEEERTKLSIKQKAAELSKKTRSSFRRKNTSGSGSRRNRRILTPGERLKASKEARGGGEDKSSNEDDDINGYI